MNTHSKAMASLTLHLSALSFVPIPTAGGSGPAGTGGGGAGPRMCEACAGAHAGTYASGRFCSAPCAKKVGARRKWAAAPKARRAKRERAPCEGCKKIHDRTYASGRFCSVHCARRVAAARKWDKNRSERSRRLDAIRPAVTTGTMPAMGRTVLLTVAPTSPPLPEKAQMQQDPQQQQRCTACPCGAALGVVYPPPQDAPQQLFYAHPLPWTVMPHPLVHPLALVPLTGPALTQGPIIHVRLPTVQVARRPVTPPQAQRPKSPMFNGTHTAAMGGVTRSGTSTPMQEDQQRHTPEGAASEALLCLGVGDPNRSFATLPRSVKVPADD